jgi:hypothetical protein
MAASCYFIVSVGSNASSLMAELLSWHGCGDTVLVSKSCALLDGQHRHVMYCTVQSHWEGAHRVHLSDLAPSNRYAWKVGEVCMEGWGVYYWMSTIRALQLRL